MPYDVKDCPGCRETFLAAVSTFGMGRRDTVPNINFSMRVAITHARDTAIAPADSIAGGFVELQARMNVPMAISNCPQVNNPANGYNPTEIRIAISELETAGRSIRRDSVVHS